MKKELLTGLLLAAAVTGTAQQLAFPGAQGWGRYATGGRLGTVYHVTNLNDSGAGSLRDAVSQPNRIIVFDVSGVINITDRITFAKNLYVAGQTAPGEGITVYGNGVSFTGADHIIVRYVRFRMGKHGTAGKDAAGIAHGTNMIFDHCSFSWGLDETFSINSDNKGELGNITIMNSIMGQGLLSHSAGGLMQADSISLYRNFYCDNSTRNNKIKGVNQYVNNIVYNWKNGCYLMGGDSEGHSYANATGNLFINGPESGLSPAFSRGNSNYHLYAADNWQDKNKNGILDAYEIPKSEYEGGPDFQTKPYNYPQLEEIKTSELIDNLLPDVGASLPYRDMVDAYMVHEVKTYGIEGALLSSEDQLPFGAPSSWTTTSFDKPVDSDGDGMPDAWELANGTDPQKDDAMTIAANGYANIENYINSLSRDNRWQWLRQPMLLSQKSSTDTTVTLSWFDFTEGEDKFILEQSTDGSSFTVVDDVPANSESFCVKGLTPGTRYIFRMKAVKGDLESDYSNHVEALTQPKKIDMVDVDAYEPDLTWGPKTFGIWDHNQKSWESEKTFTDGAKVLFAPENPTVVLVNDTVKPQTVVVRGSGKITLRNNGVIAGVTSVNKAGDGELVMNNDGNTYTGANVIHGGKVSFSSIANGGEPSALGAPMEFAQNWIWDGGIWNYTGRNAATNRSAQLYNDTELDVNDGRVLTMNGTINGQANVTFGGKGTIKPGSPAFFNYTGETILKDEAVLSLEYLNSLIDKHYYLGDGKNVSKKLVLQGGKFSSKDGSNHDGSYMFPIEVRPTEDGSPSIFTVNRRCKINCDVTGSGDLEYDIPYVREYLQGDWTQFYGRLYAKGMGTDTDGSQLMLQNGFKGFPNTPITLQNNTRVLEWGISNATCELGGLSGEAGTFLSCGSKDNGSARMKWIVGSANTDEVFNGVIDNRCSARGHNGSTSIEKLGTGDWTLNGNNVYSGTTDVSGGRLIVNGNIGSSSKFTVGDNGVLAGSGTIASPVTATGAIEAVVDGTADKPLVKALTFNNTLTVNGAVLKVNLDSLKGNLVVGTELKVLNLQTAINGTGFTSVESSRVVSGLSWDTSRLNTEGIIVVADPTGIAAVPVDKTDSESPIYDLSGRRVSNPVRGFFVSKGEKFVRK
jgi:autotransporter-associated beta strand protein